MQAMTEKPETTDIRRSVAATQSSPSPVSAYKTRMSTEEMSGVARTRRYPVGDFVHVRRDNADGTKSFYWEGQDGSHGLGGMPVSDLPLFADEQLGRLPDGADAYLTEGEKAMSALRWAGCTAAGTVTGAATIPGDATLSRLARLRPCLWADKDEPGREHMARIAARLSALGCSRLDLLRWEDAPPHGDAADFITELRRRGLPREEMAAAVAALPRVPFTAVEDGQR